MTPIVNCLVLASLALAPAAAFSAAGKVPDVCAMYFNFTSSTHSDMYFGVANKDGSITQRAHVGSFFDPQGRITVASDGSSIALPVISNLTAKDHYGCCSKTSVMQVSVTYCWPTP